jgi:hypothetical protein
VVVKRSGVKLYELLGAGENDGYTETAVVYIGEEVGASEIIKTCTTKPS